MRHTGIFLCILGGVGRAGCGAPAASTQPSTQTVRLESISTETVQPTQPPQVPTDTSQPAMPTRTSLPVLTPSAAVTDCTQGWTRLKVDTYAKVTGLESDPPMRVRSEPAKGENVIAQIYPGTVVKVAGGPVCADGMVFWQVEHASLPGGTGWTAEGNGQEYWLEPHTAAAETVRLSAFGVSFEVPGSWSAVPQAEIVPAKSVDNFCEQPEYIKITLTSYPARSEWKPTLYVERTELKPDWFPACDWVPELKVHAKALTRGERHLFGSMNAQPIFNSEFLYEYKGTSPDGKYTVYAFLPVNYPLLANSFQELTLPAGGIPFDVNSQNWDGYYEAVKAQLEAAGEADFTPGLGVLDGVVESIEVGG